ncbi:MAG: hypothetical protein HFI46_16470 [Lachnospiraceae bacterium]|jgi:hypothetical protein|nr:hypothetical protein [Lachnospiraceae bacterium]
MLTTEEVYQMERQLLESVSEKFIKDGEGSPDNEAYYNAFAAVLDLRIYLQKKERQKCG